jgi:hypothetical protein
MTLEAPIPGQSLTAEPGKYAWQKPPKYVTQEETLKYYLTKFNNVDVIDDLLFTLEAGYPLRALVETLCTMSVMKGMHTIDVSVLVSPIIHEYLKGIAQAAGIEFEEGLYEDQAKEEKQKQRAKLRMLKAIQKAKKPDAGTELMEEITAASDEEAPEAMAEAPMEEPMAEAPTAEAPPTATPPVGLMSRGM